MTEAAALAAYVEGKISFGAFRNAVSDSTSFVFEPNGTVHIESHRSLPEITIHAEDVRRALKRYQNGELTLEELAMWGLVLHNLDAFETDAMGDRAAEKVWAVISQLAVAAVNPAFDDARVTDLLAGL